MKKFLCIVLSALLAMGALSLCAGCAGTEVKDEAKRKEVIAAFDNTELSMFEMTVETSEESSCEAEDEHSSSHGTGRADVSVYEENGLVYGDMYMSITADAESENEDYSQSDSSRSYAFAFARGDMAYAAAGEWEARGVKEGDFDALIEDYRADAVPLTGENVSALFDWESLGQGDTEAYLMLATHLKGKVFKTLGGYRIEYDVVDSYRQMMKNLESAAPYYEQHPDATVSELFAAAGMAGAEKSYFFPAADGHGPEPASIFGPPEEFAANMKRDEKQAEKVLASNLFSISGLGEDDKAAVTFKVAAALTDKLEFKDLSMKLSVSAEFGSKKEKPWSASKTEVSVKLKALSERPAVRSLTGLTAELYRPAAGTFSLKNEGTVWLYEAPAGENYLHGNLTGEISVHEDGTAVFTLTFTGEGKLPAETETWTVGLVSLAAGETADHVFFTGYGGGSYLGIHASVTSAGDDYWVTFSQGFAGRKLVKEFSVVTL